ncbi:MAG: hypothetical protein AAGA21_10665 [Pseudomonadota bacterium]
MLQKRKSRRKRVGTGGGRNKRFLPGPEDWVEVEGALGASISDENRERITALVDEYLERDQSEKSAPFVDEALRILDRIDLETEQLIVALKTDLDGSGDEESAGEYVELMIAAEMPGQSYTPEDYANLKHQLGHFRIAYEKARLAIQQSSEGGFAEGTAWANLFLQIMKLFHIRSRKGNPNLGMAERRHSCALLKCCRNYSRLSIGDIFTQKMRLRPR